MALSRHTLDPYVPTRSDPWDEAKASHLLRRAGFGASRAEVQRVLRRGPERAIREWLDPDRPASGMPEPAWLEEARALRAVNPAGLSPARQREMREKNERFLRELQQWWIRRMLTNPNPLEETLTLFWHSHFATSAEKVKDPLMLYEQQLLFRRFGLGHFHLLVLMVSMDPAMIRFLDSESNVKGRPNENFARELMELYTLGEGNYTEEDIREIARAFTGWTLRKHKYYFDRSKHDGGAKTVFGQTGPFEGSDVVSLLMDQPAFSIFLPGKLFAHYAYRNPPPALVEQLGEIFRASGFEVRAVLERILRSEAFYSDAARTALIKNPAHYVLGSLRALEVSDPPVELLPRILKVMGQDLFFPPDVNGWPEGSYWINTNSLMMRYHYAYFLTTGELPSGFNVRGSNNDNRFLRKPLEHHELFENPSARRDPNRAVDVISRSLFGTPMRSPQREQMVRYLQTASNGARVVYDLEKPASRERVMNTVYLMMCSPDYQTY